jgi:energy-coupling factor transport system permease protein
MANFEYTQNLSFGQFLPLNSWLHQRDARAKLISYLLLVIVLTLLTDPILILFGLAFILSLYILAKIPLAYAFRGLLTPLPFLALIAILQLFRFAPSESNPLLFNLWALTITPQGVFAALILIIRFTALILVISLSSFTISTSDMIYGMQSLLRPLNWVGIPSEDLIMIFQITIRFLPMLGQAVEQIAKAQAARGAEWGVKKISLLQRVRVFIPVLVPMFLTSLQRAENMALAMDARGYGSHIKRGSYKTFEFKIQDGLFMAAVLLISIAMILL